MSHCAEKIDLTAAQRELLATYADGDLAYLIELAESDPARYALELRERADGLALFLLYELDASAGCDSLKEACRRIDAACDQLHELRDAMAGEIDRQEQIQRQRN